MPFSDQTIQQFIDKLASSAPAPGGGTAAALAGAQSAALIAMVCRLTIGRKNYESVSAELEAILPRAEARCRVLMELMEADAAAYEAVIATYKLPKETEQDKAARTEATQEALKRAAEVPFQIAGACADLLDIVLPVAAKGNKNAASDAGAAALLAEAGMRAGILNVEINLKAIQDETFKREMSERITHLATRRAGLIDIIRIVESRM